MSLTYYHPLFKRSAKRGVLLFLRNIPRKTGFHMFLARFCLDSETNQVCHFYCYGRLFSKVDPIIERVVLGSDNMKCSG